jgi:hypothetical protein
MACQSRRKAESGVGRCADEGSSWLASTKEDVQETGDRILSSDFEKLLVVGLPNCLWLAGDDQESDQRPSDQGRELLRVESRNGAMACHCAGVADDSRRPTSMAGEGFRRGEPQL